LEDWNNDFNSVLLSTAALALMTIHHNLSCCERERLCQIELFNCVVFQVMTIVECGYGVFLHLVLFRATHDLDWMQPVRCLCSTRQPRNNWRFDPGNGQSRCRSECCISITTVRAIHSLLAQVQLEDPPCTPSAVQYRSLELSNTLKTTAYPLIFVKR